MRHCPAPPPGLLTEALWGLVARAACTALQPAAAEIAGAASGLLTAGPVRDYLAEAEPLVS